MKANVCPLADPTRIRHLTTSWWRASGHRESTTRAARYALCAVLGALLASVHAGAAAAQPNPFAEFESFRLPNGMKVWYRHLPGAATTSMALIVPAGRDDDPAGAAQTAHLLEHVLLSDRAGGSEADHVRELARRGGSSNAVTAADRMYFTVHIDSDEARFALQWLFGVVSPRIFSENVVERSRAPVAIEIGARRRIVLERIVLGYMFLPGLRPPGFWEREFGIDVPADRIIDPARTLNGISAADLQQFHDAHYSPAHMTLVIAGAQPRSAILPLLNETFALLPWRPVPARTDSAAPRTAESRRFSWHSGSSTQLNVLYRVRDMGGRDQLRLIFIEDLLQLRLMERLRRGADKAVYGVTVTTETRRDAALVRLRAEVHPHAERSVRSIIDDELQRLRAAPLDSAAFYTDRDLLSRRLRVENSAPAALVAWATERFYDPARHDVFPDLGEYYATVGPDSISALAQRVFAPQNRILRVQRALPLPLPWIALLGILIVVATVLAWRRATLQPADMSAIRYVARIRPPLATRAITTALIVITGLVLLRGAASAIHFVAERMVLPIDSPILHGVAVALVIALFTLAALTAAGLSLYKVLVFEHEIRLKSRTYRAIVLPAAILRDVRLVRSREGLQLRRPAPPGAGEAVFIQRVSGDGYLIRVRRPDALHAAVRRLLDASSSPEG